MKLTVQYITHFKLDIEVHKDIFSFAANRTQHTQRDLKNQETKHTSGTRVIMLIV
jgi:hypothetical protein